MICKFELVDRCSRRQLECQQWEDDGKVMESFTSVLMPPILRICFGNFIAEQLLMLRRLRVPPSGGFAKIDATKSIYMQHESTIPIGIPISANTEHGSLRVSTVLTSWHIKYAKVLFRQPLGHSHHHMLFWP